MSEANLFELCHGEEKLCEANLAIFSHNHLTKQRPTHYNHLIIITAQTVYKWLSSLYTSLFRHCLNKKRANMHNVVSISEHESATHIPTVPRSFGIRIYDGTRNMKPRNMAKRVASLTFSTL